MKATATDKNGRVWHFPVTYWAIKRIRKECGVDLCEIFTTDLSTRLKTDYPLMLEVGYQIVHDTAADRKVSFQEWVDGWDAEDLDTLVDAIIEGIALFFPPDRRAIIVMAMRALKEAMEAALQAMTSKLGSGDAPESQDSTPTVPHSAPSLPQPMPVD